MNSIVSNSAIKKLNEKVKFEHRNSDLPPNIGDEDTNFIEQMLIEPVAKGIWRTVTHYSKTISVC